MAGGETQLSLPGRLGNERATEMGTDSGGTWNRFAFLDVAWCDRVDLVVMLALYSSGAWVAVGSTRMDGQGPKEIGLPLARVE
jgi:hypothetical protein